MLSIVADKEGQKGPGTGSLQPVLAALLGEGVHFGHELLGTTTFTGTRLGDIALRPLVLQLLFLLRPLLPLQPNRKGAVSAAHLAPLKASNVANNRIRFVTICCAKYCTMHATHRQIAVCKLRLFL